MPGPQIGIMLANKEFYTVLNEDVPSRKRLVVTTVTDNQTTIQIHLYQKMDNGSKPEYLDTLLIEDIIPRKKGGPSIVLVLGIDESRNLYAKATDKDTGNSQSLKVSLAKSGTIISNSNFELPDFDVTSFPSTEVDDDPLRDNVLISDSEAEGTMPTNLYTYDTKDSEKHFSIKGLIIIIILLLLLAGIVTFIFKPKFLAPLFGTRSEPANTVTEPEPTKEPEDIAFVEVPAEPIPEPEPEPVVEPVKEPEPVVKEPPKPAVPKKPAPAKKAKTVRYKIKWGDTLWDICGTYYKNPWRYKYLARWNGIKDPDLIISGTYIEIPPR